MSSAHQEREARNRFNSAVVHRAAGPEVKGTGSSKVLDALSCYLRIRLILVHN